LLFASVFLAALLEIAQLAAAGAGILGNLLRVAELRVFRIGRRLGRFYRQNEREARMAGARSLKIRHADLVDSTCELDLPLQIFRHVETVVVDHQGVVDIEHGAIVGNRTEAACQASFTYGSGP
jgi:hypothetical protein